jgi:hypothetical protein
LLGERHEGEGRGRPRRRGKRDRAIADHAVTKRRKRAFIALFCGSSRGPPPPEQDDTPTRPVADAIDTKRHLSATPSTPIGDVDGVADRSAILSPTPSTCAAGGPTATSTPIRTTRIALAQTLHRVVAAAHASGVPTPPGDNAAGRAGVRPPPVRQSPGRARRRAWCARPCPAA